MTALLEMKQRIKGFYGRYETYLLPVLKFLLAMVYFSWINSVLKFSNSLGSIFVVLILALICAILPSNCILVFGFVLIVGQCYTLGIEVAAFALILILLMLILFLRFSPGANLAMVFTPLGFMFHIPALIPLGTGLLGNPLAAAPAACGVILKYFIAMVNEQASVLKSEETEIPQKLKVLLDGLLKNQEMWVTVAVFVIVVLLVYYLRTRSNDYAWRVAIVVGTIIYVAIFMIGGLVLDVNVSMILLAVEALIAAILGLILEFFAFGGDYTRTEHLEFEDDDYYYFVRAIPKASVTTPVRQIKKINKKEETAPIYEPVKEDNTLPLMPEEIPMPEDIAISDEIIAPQAEVDFEKKLEESLKDL